MGVTAVHTYSPQTFVNTEALQDLHTSTISDIHFGPLGRVEVALDHQAWNPILGKLQCCNHSRGAAADDEDWDIARERLCILGLRCHI